MTNLTIFLNKAFYKSPLILNKKRDFPKVKPLLLL